jgi:superfamily I DNA/RNA helicase
MHSMANLRLLRPEWSEQTLSVTYRCPRVVVERQREFVPLFQAGPDNLEGLIESLSEWTPKPNSAVLCRNNAPLISLAFRLLRKRIPVNLLGRDIGKEMKRLWNKLSNHGKRSVDSTIAEAQRLREIEPKKADKYNSLIVVLQNTRNIEEMEAFLKESRNAITLATGHKAKGLEWDTVYHLEPGLIPSQHAETEEELQQEYNLRYVIETRTRNELFFVRLGGLQ